MNFNKNLLHQLAQNEGNSCYFRMSKNTVSNETCGRYLENCNLNDKITLTYTRNIYYICACGSSVGRSLATAELNLFPVDWILLLDDTLPSKLVFIVSNLLFSHVTSSGNVENT